MRSICFSVYILASVFTLYAPQAAAQGGKEGTASSQAEKIFTGKDDIDISWDTPGYSNKGDNKYWIEKDTLYAKGGMICACIALADIDVAQKDIRQHERVAVANTGKKVYSLFLHPVKGKKAFSSGFCFNDDFSGLSGREEPLELYLADKQQAEDAFIYLEKQSETGKFLAELSEFLNEDEKKKTEASTESSTNDFDSQLLALSNGVKDNFQALNDGMIKEGAYKCKVQLEGAKSTIIHIGMLRNVYLTADFGEFSTYAEAQKVYDSVKSKVAASKKMPCTMAMMDEIVMETGRNQSWTPFDMSGTLDPALKGLFLELELIKSFTFTKDYKKLDIYLVALTIKKR